jgi:hydrogenase expression/formation protein HypC
LRGRSLPMEQDTNTSKNSKELSLLLVLEEVKIGDYVLVHAGFAIQKVDEEAATDALNFLKEIAQSLDQGNTPE